MSVLFKVYREAGLQMLEKVLLEELNVAVPTEVLRTLMLQRKSRIRKTMIRSTRVVLVIASGALS